MAFTLFNIDGYACTNFIVTKGASADGSVMVTYAADSHQLYGELYHTDGAFFPRGSKLAVAEWDTGKPLCTIPQAQRTYSTMGNMNEHQVIITETTFGGLPQLVDTTATFDYGSLIYITLQRACSAREAINIMGDFVKKYGYCSEGESFTVADKNEAWIMEMVGKGVRLDKKGRNLNKGAAWVAQRIPDGSICAHANHSRITTFPMDDPENCIYSKDIIKFARKSGLYKGERDEDFSFSDTFNPANAFDVRVCEGRVWSFFNKVCNGQIGDRTADSYLDYILGKNLSDKMPLYIKPPQKISVKKLADAMRDHFEGTPMDMTKGIGAGGFECPYRWRPMTFEVNGHKYLNERATATQQTGFWILCQARNWLPDAIGGIIWFGVDDTATSCLTPVYSSGLHAPACFAEGNGNMIEYSSTSAFWLFNRVAQLAYLRYNYIAPEIRRVADEHENGAIKIIPTVDKEALRIYDSYEADDSLQRENMIKKYLTEWSDRFADRMFGKWKKLDKYLLVKYIDGNIKKTDAEGRFITNGYSDKIPVYPNQPGYDQTWKNAVDMEATAKERAAKLAQAVAEAKAANEKTDSVENDLKTIKAALQKANQQLKAAKKRAAKAEARADAAEAANKQTKEKK
ncbi:MAG: C69 family dipeptidase [Bacteroidales bacterium]|nr:C69 family dipeptidase [Bacteroidales bacterium]